MMCEQAELRMAELLVGEISSTERAALEQHLLDCESCRGDFELARAGTRAEWADVPVPKELIEATLASFREPPAAVRMLRWATAAAAVFGVAVLLMTSSRAPRNAPVAAAPPRVERREVLATMQDAVVGALVCKDEDGRPVGELGLKSHDVTVEILDGIAKTTVEENFENHTDRRLEGTFNFPLPSDASISRLALEVNGKIEEGTCLERERAREVFESIVRRMQDPALLEWQPGGFFKCRVFPIEPRSTKRVIVAYTQALPCFRGKMTYVYPLASEKTRTHPPEEVRISVLARFSGALAKIESPSHRLDVQRRNANEASMSFRATHYRPNNDFVVTLEPGDEEVRVVSHRPEGEDGYFACILSPRGGAERAPGRYAFVLDASASISAPRLEVAKRLVRAMMERRIPGDRFEILAHNVEVERSGEVDLRAANDFMDRLRPIGGSDVLKALQAAGDAEAIYIGKGSPSFGETDPGKILEALKGRRIRTIAVGSDANGLLLERLGGMMRVSPNDDVDKRVAEIAATIGSPVLSELKVEGEGIAEVVGARDLFYGGRLVLSGRYRDGATKLRVTGSGYRREVEVAFPTKEEGNNYVRRLWAQRKVSDLLAQGESKKAEVTALGVKHQIMTPYTSFLVLETEQMWKDHQLKREVQKQVEVLGKQVEEEKKRIAEAEAAVRDAAARELPAKREVLQPSRPAETPASPVTVAPPVIKTPPPPAPVTIPPARDPIPAPREMPKPEKTLEADEHYRLGERYYQVGDFEKASLETQKALRLNPNHAAAKALYTENQFILGQGRAMPSTQEYDKFMVQGIVRHQQLLVEIDNAYERGQWEYREGRTEQAEKEFRKIVEFAKWMPTGVEIEARRKAAVEMIGRTGRNEFSSPVKLELYDVQDLTYAMADFPGVDISLAQDLVVNDAAKMTAGPGLIGEVTKLNQELNRAQKSLAEELAKTEEERILDTENSSRRLATSSEVRGFVKKLERPVTKADELEFPDMATWKELIAKRQPKGLTALDESINDEDKTIVDKLHSIRITIDMQNAPLTAIVDHVREISGLNIHISGIDNPDAEILSVKSRDEVLGSALRRILEPRKKTYVVRDGVVIITTPEAILQLRWVSEDGSKVLLAGKGIDIGALVAVARNSKFVALLRVERVIEGAAAARVLQGLAVGRILPGDGVMRVGDAAAYLSKLPEDVRKDLASRTSQQAIRAKMGLKQ